ncbi:histidine phosphatase [Curtobacterium flaccumfaciens UCD-AKU]|uniref:MSMEG_4193 family putative phosphomutase n=1 Tax=Curtobacterium flaccumfaciens TaxID=2035 RepID=UPI00036479BC|nr:MSMEG_4193 family putative phosphomutase [Curtobacterium flaccumfaciens]EYT65521.1 histidine phosphatase [Curtobacterium flaccumfaciens UCD-AKU]
MATVLLVRHGRTTANATGVLAGRTAGVRLDAVGRTQAERTAERIAAVPVAAVVSSPLERCRQTARAILDRQPGRQTDRQPDHQPGRQTDRQSGASDLLIERAITEADYGQWQGRKLADLAKEPLWRTVQANPSAVVFPGGESMQTMQSRAVAAVRRIDAEVEAEHGPGAVWVAVSHGDIIKSVLADAFGMHLDLFQRIGVGPASVSVVRYGEHRPEVVATNTESGDLSWLRTAPAPSGEAAVGGGAGHPEPDAHTGTGRPAPDAPGGPARP